MQGATPGGVPAAPIELAAILNRATSHRPTPPDDFARDQTSLRDLFDANDAERDEWLSGLTLAESRFVLGQLDIVAEEHRRRAHNAEKTAEWIRAAHAQAARDGQKVSPDVAMTATAR